MGFGWFPRNRITNQFQKLKKGITMKWSTPAAQDMRFGFEITMYIANR